MVLDTLVSHAFVQTQHYLSAIHRGTCDDVSITLLVCDAFDYSHQDSSPRTDLNWAIQICMHCQRSSARPLKKCIVLQSEQIILYANSANTIHNGHMEVALRLLKMCVFGRRY